MPEWLEQELAHDLAPVRAPQALWVSIRTRAPRPRHRRVAWPWAAAGSVAAAALVLLVALSQPSLTQFAATQLAENENPDFRSHNPQEISRWLREHAGVEVALPAETKVDLQGACTVRRRGSIFGGIMYRVDARNAILLVSRTAKMKAPARHGESTWTAHNQLYALAFSGPSGSHLPCQLCHVD